MQWPAVGRNDSNARVEVGNTGAVDHSYTTLRLGTLWIPFCVCRVA